MQCQECGAPNEADAKFCTSCGAAMPAAAPAAQSRLKPLDTTVDHAEQEYVGGQGRISYRIDGTTLQVVTIELEPLK